MKFTLFPLLATLFTLLPTLTAAADLFGTDEPVVHNMTARTFGAFGWSKQQCATVSGQWAQYKYNFGCLCLDDLDDFCDNNNINDYVKNLLYYYISVNGRWSYFPPNAQPTCDGQGGYNCGSLPMKSDGTCGSTTCGSHQCSTNGGCCPRGQTYKNGKCCGSVGCSRSGQTCSPAYSCPSGNSISNGVCCPNGQTGYENSYCCPAGQIGSNGKCGCPAGTQMSRSGTCDSVCTSSQKWCNTQCCPTGASENSNKQCVCDSTQQVLSGSGANAKCVDRCTGNNAGFTFYNTVCCPAGSQEDGKTGVCKCTNSQQKLVTNNGVASCVNRCSNSGFSWCNTVCCPSGSQEDGSTGVCKCTNPQQKLVTTNGVASCVNKCSNSGFSWCNTVCCPDGSSEDGWTGQCKCTDPGKKIGTVNGQPACVSKCKDSSWSWCKTTCCKSYLSEDSNGNCVCPQVGYLDNGSSCQPKCTSTQKYNTNTGNCDPICDTSAGYYYQTGWKNNGMCCKKGASACNTVCCPAGTEEIGNTGVCCTKGSTVVNNKCVSPTGGNGGNTRRALAGRFFDGTQMVVPATSQTYGIEANKDGKLCPTQMAACPVEGREGEYECLDSQSDLQSCGGCASMGQGQDCTQIKGARWMGCNQGQCEVYSCKKGWKKSADGTKCVIDQKLKK